MNCILPINQVTDTILYYAKYAKKGKTLTKADTFQLSLSFLSALGLAGVILSNINFFWICRHENLFQEIQFKPKEIIGGILADSLPVIESRIAVLEDSIAVYPKAAGEKIEVKNMRFERQFKTDTAKRSQLYRYAHQSANMAQGDSVSFSTLNKGLRFDIDLERLHRWEKFPDSPRTARASFFEPLSGFRADTLIHFKTVPYTRNLDFFNRYPGFARYFFIVFIFSGFCFISVASCIYLTTRRERLFKDYRIEGHSQREYFVFAAAMIVLLSLIAFLWKCTFYDASVIKNMYFMQTFSNRLRWMEVLGIVAGAFCLAGFLHSGILLDFFKKEVRRDKREQIESIKATEIIAGAGELLPQCLLHRILKLFATGICMTELEKPSRGILYYPLLSFR